MSIVTGAVYYLGVSAGAPSTLMVLLALGIGLPLRVLSLVFKWEMPKFVFDRDMRE